MQPQRFGHKRWHDYHCLGSEASSFNVICECDESAPLSGTDGLTPMCNAMTMSHDHEQWREDENGGWHVFLAVLGTMVGAGAIFGTAVGVHFCCTQNKLQSIAVSGGGAGLFSFACVIIGIAGLAHQPPSDEEAMASHCDLRDKWWEGHQVAMIIFGLVCLFLGIAGIIGASLAVVAVRQKNNCCVMASTITQAIVGGVVILMILGSMGRLAEGASACPDPCRHAAKSDMHCCWNDDCACRAAIEWACETWNLGMASMVFFTLFALLAIISSSCGCGASCCCQQVFGMDPAQSNAGPSATVVGQAVVGQPVGQAAADDNKSSNHA
jgi:hypothetical protein